MTDWIDEVRKEKQEREARQVHTQREFDDLASRLWNGFAAVSEGEVKEIKEKMRLNLEFKRRGDHIEIRKRTFPTHIINVKLESDNHRIIITRAVRQQQVDQPDITTEQVDLYLGGDGNVHMKIGGKDITARELSETILRPLVM